MSRIVPDYVEYVTKFACILPSGKLNILIDGQFGSTGKGVIAQYDLDKLLRKLPEVTHLCFDKEGEIELEEYWNRYKRKRYVY